VSQWRLSDGCSSALGVPPISDPVSSMRRRLLLELAAVSPAVVRRCKARVPSPVSATKPAWACAPHQQDTDNIEEGVTIVVGGLAIEPTAQAQRPALA